MEKPLPRPSKIGDSQKNNYSLFVVDDDDCVRTSLARRLRREGFQVQEFNSGEAVLANLDDEARKPDAIITDFKMTGLNGIETTIGIRQRSCSIPVILLTAYSGVVDKEEAERAGVYKILIKTIDLESLPELICQAIQHQVP